MLPEEGTVSISEIEQKIKRVIARYAMLPSGCTVVVGFSGGADSAALTHFLFSHREEYGVSVVAATMGCAPPPAMTRRLRAVSVKNGEFPFTAAVLTSRPWPVNRGFAWRIAGENCAMLFSGSFWALPAAVLQRPIPPPTMRRRC